MAEAEILVGVKHMILWTFIMILWSFTCDSNLLSVSSAHNFMLIHIPLFPWEELISKIKRLNQYIKSY